MEASSTDGVSGLAAGETLAARWNPGALSPDAVEDGGWLRGNQDTVDAVWTTMEPLTYQNPVEAAASWAPEVAERDG